MNVLLLLLLFINEPITVKVSVYNPVKAQCDYDPTLTASGTRICTSRLEKGRMTRYISVSRDLLKKFKYGSYVTIKSNNPYYNGKWRVVDTMHKRYKMKIDFLQAVGDAHVPPKTVKIL